MKTFTRSLLAGFVVSGLLFAACGGDDDTNAEPPGETSTIAPTSTPGESTGPTPDATATNPVDDGETHVIEDFFGEVEVPVSPQRIVAGASISLGNMLALGVKPIAAAVNPNSLPIYLEGQMEGIEDVRGENGIDLERVLALNPDLLISFGGSAENPFRQEQCELWKQALPTFCYEYWYAYEEEIKKNLTEVARALNIEERGAEVIAEYDARIEELRQKVVEVGFDDKPVTVVRIFQDGTFSIRIGTTESIIFRDIGIPQPEGQRNPDDFALELSEENLIVLNEAYAVLVYIDDNSSTTEEQIRSSEVWQLLTPVQEGRLVFVNSGVWNSIDLLGAHAIMDDIENLVLPLAEE